MRRVLAILGSVALAACGSPDAPFGGSPGGGPPIGGGRDAGCADGGADGGDGGCASDGGPSDGGADAGCRADGGDGGCSVATGSLRIAWTIDGASDQKPGRCGLHNVGWFGVDVSPGPLDGGADAGVDCATGEWTVTFRNVPAGPVDAGIRAVNATCCIDGPIVSSKRVVVIVPADGGTGTAAFDLRAEF